METQYLPRTPEHGSAVTDDRASRHSRPQGTASSTAPASPPVLGPARPFAERVRGATGGGRRSERRTCPRRRRPNRRPGRRTGSTGGALRLGAVRRPGAGARCGSTSARPPPSSGSRWSPAPSGVVRRPGRRHDRNHRGRVDSGASRQRGLHRRRDGRVGHRGRAEGLSCPSKPRSPFASHQRFGVGVEHRLRHRHRHRPVGGRRADRGNDLMPLPLTDGTSTISGVQRDEGADAGRDRATAATRRPPGTLDLSIRRRGAVMELGLSVTSTWPPRRASARRSRGAAMVNVSGPNGRMRRPSPVCPASAPRPRRAGTRRRRSPPPQQAQTFAGHTEPELWFANPPNGGPEPAANGCRDGSASGDLRPNDRLRHAPVVTRCSCPTVVQARSAAGVGVSPTRRRLFCCDVPYVR